MPLTINVKICIYHFSLASVALLPSDEILHVSENYVPSAPHLSWIHSHGLNVLQAQPWAVAIWGGGVPHP